MATLPPEIIALKTQYESSQAKLIDIIANAETKGNSTTYRNRILNSVNEELRTLDKFASEWVNDNIPKAYEKGVNDAYTAYRALNIDVSKVAASQKVLKNLVDNTLGQLTDASQFVGRRIKDDLRQAGVEAIVQKLSMGDTVKQTKANLLKKMSDKGITAIVDKRGRNINLDSYAEMVARTTTREATNQGTLDEVTGNGRDLVQITSHFSSCPMCSVYEGRVYSISGKDKEYPKLAEVFSGGFSTIHPNCSHSVTPYIVEFDDNAEQLKADSNKPFEIQKKDKASLDAYNKSQKIKSQRRLDRNEWEASKLANPDITPKTFSGYRAAKRTDNAKYKAIKESINKIKVVTPVKVVFVSVKTIEEAKVILTAITGIQDVNFGRMPVKLANEYLEGLHEYYLDNPMLKGFAEKFDTSVGKNFGVVKFNGIKVNEKFELSNSISLKSTTQYDKIVSEYKQNIDVGQAFTLATPKTTAIHESVHLLDYMIGMTRTGSCIDGKMVAFKAYRLDDAVTSVADEIIRKTRQQLYGKQFGQEVYDGSKYLGKYAMINNKEMLCEAISYEYTGETNIFSKTVKELFEKKRDDVFNKNINYVSDQAIKDFLEGR